MNNKVFEVRDRATFIPVMAVKFDGADIKFEEDYLMRRAGFGKSTTRDYTYLVHLQTGKGNYDPYKWGNNDRTLHEAHKYIHNNFYDLNPGEVIDIEFILGESQTKKESERFTGWDM